MFNAKFGIEIEFTGITRSQAAEVAAQFLNGRVENCRDSYDTKKVHTPDGRAWKFMSDGSIRREVRATGRSISADGAYSVELVSPILTYREDIATLQELVRQSRKAEAFTNPSCGIHIHLNGADHTPRSIRNFINIIASKNDLFYKALQIEHERMRFCKKMDAALVEKINARKPKTMRGLEELWYEGYCESRSRHYHESRYHFLNLHSFWHGNHTVEWGPCTVKLCSVKRRIYVIPGILEFLTKQTFVPNM